MLLILSLKPRRSVTLRQGRVITGPHQSVNDVVSNARFTNGEVKRYHTSNLLNDGKSVANHDARLQHGAVRKINGIDTVVSV